MVKGSTEAMSTWIGRVKSAAHQLGKIDVTVTDEDTILVLTNSLDATYDSFIISLDATPTKQLTLELVANHLLNEEVRRENRDELEGKGDEADTAMVARVGSAVTAGPRVCWRCGETGHYKQFCPHKKPKVDSDGAGGKMAAMTTRTGGAGTDISKLVDLGTLEVGEREPGQVY